MLHSDKFTKYRLETSQSPAFRALNIYAKALFPQLRLEWRSETHNNNGNIRYSASQAAMFLGCTEVTALKASADLQRKGLVRITEVARLSANGMAKGHSYEITDIPMPGAKAPSFLFKEWNPEEEFEVLKARANNPKGYNGK